MIRMDYSTMTEDELIELYEKGDMRDRDYVKLIEDKKIRVSKLLKYDYSIYSSIKRTIYNAIAKKISDDEKMPIISSASKNYDVDYLILSLKNEENIIYAISNYVTREYRKYSLLKEFDSDNIRMHFIPTIEDEFDRVDIIRDLKDDGLKIKCLEYLSQSNSKAIVIASMNISDGRKILLLPDDADEDNKTQVFIGCKKDETKNIMLDVIESENNKVHIIRSLSNDEEKIKNLERVESDSGKAKIIADLKDDETKLRLLEEINDTAARILILISLNDEKKSRELLEKEGVKFNGKYKDYKLDYYTTIGTEIECEGEYSYFILKNGKILNWETKDDGSLEDGVECTSPVMGEGCYGVEYIYGVCSILQKLGQNVSERCGGHIHIGAGILENAEAYKILMEMWGNVELPLYLISNEEGNLPREDIELCASPINYKVVNSINRGVVDIEDSEDIEDVVEAFKNIQGGRESGINFFNVDYHNYKNTIEFRTPNGTLDPDTWIENARLFGRLVETSEKLAEIELKDEKDRTEDENVKLFLLESLKEGYDDGEKLEILLDLLFDEEEKDVYIKRYGVNKNLYEELPNNEKLILEEGRPIDLNTKKKHKKDEMREIAIKEKYSDIEAAMKESIKEVMGDLENIDYSERG